MEAPQQGLQDVQEGPGDRALVLARLLVPGIPGFGEGGNAGLGVAVQGDSTAGAVNSLAIMTP